MLEALLQLSVDLFKGIHAVDGARRQEGDKARDAAADDFMPVLSFVVLKANPRRLASALTLIAEWRDQDSLFGQTGYYYVSLCVATSYLSGDACLKTSGLTDDELAVLKSMPIDDNDDVWQSVLDMTTSEEQVDEIGDGEWVLLEHPTHRNHVLKKQPL
jgi:hypothetical protein